MSDRPLLLDALRRESSRERMRTGTGSVLLAGATLIGLLALLAALLGGGRWIVLPPQTPVLMLSVVGLVALAVLGFAWRAVRRTTELVRLARAVEVERQLRRGSLSGLLEIGDTPVAARAAARLAMVVPPDDPAPLRRRRSRRLLLAGSGALLVASAGFTWSSTYNRDGISALRHPMLAASGGLLEPLRVLGPRTVRRGSSATIEIRAPERRSVRLHMRMAGDGWQISSHRVVNSIARVDLGSVASTVVLFASDARGRTDTIAITPSDRPFVQELSLRAVYPRYLGRPEELLPTDGQLIVPAGTELRIAGRASEPLSDAALHDDARLIPLQITGTHFSGSTTLHRSSILGWRMTALGGGEVETPHRLHIAVTADEPPEVEIITPAADTTVGGDAPVRIAVRASDDHELSAVSLVVRRRGADELVPLPVPPAGGSAAIFLDLSSLEPGERVAVRAIAVEAAGAARRTSSSPRTISVLTASEQRDAARLAADSAASVAAGMVATQRQVERNAVQVSRARDRRDAGSPAGSSAAGHALASRARAIVEEQRGLSSRADSLAAATRALEARLARAGALDDGLAARLAEVRSLLQRALTPELAARLRDAENAAREDAEEPLRRALADVALEQRRVREQLERVVGMLRRAAIEGSLETLRAEASELAQEAAGFSQRQPAAALPARDAALPSRTGQLRRDIAGVIARLEDERARAGLGPARAAAGHAERAAGVLTGRVPDRGTAADALEGSAESLAAARAAQIAEWKQELAADLDAAVQELMQLAVAEDELARRVAGGSGEWRDEHSSLEEAATVVADRVTRAARMSTLVSSRSDGLVRAARDGVVRVSAQSFPARDRTQTSALMRDAAASLSRAAASLVRDRERTNSARSASGFTELLEELQRLADRQRGLNAASAGLPLGLAGAGAMGARDRARTLARQQREVARALEELGDADGGARAQPLAAEANRLADALERAAIDASVLARQERLYHRLLQGGRLLTGDSGEEGERREAVTATGTTLPVLRDPGQIPTGPRRHQVPGWAELRTLTPAERQMIVEYFERLNGGR